MRVCWFKKNVRICCIVLLFIYSLLTGIYFFLHTTRSRVNISALFGQVTDSLNIRLTQDMNLPPADNRVDAEIARQLLDGKFHNHSSNHSRPCISTYAISIDEQLKKRLEEKNMMPYFNIGSQSFVSVPAWQRERVPPKSSNHTKYYVASVLRVRLYEDDLARWTVRELKQWLHYQFWAGTEHVYICIHFLNESERFHPELTKYIEQGLVSVVYWANITANPKSKNYPEESVMNQVACYNYILDNHRDEAVWHYNFDMDENPYVPGDTCEGFLPRYLKKVDPKTSELRLKNFVFHGQGDRRRDMFYDRLNRISPKEFNGNVKPIYRVSMTTKAGMHGSKTTGRTVYPDRNELIMIHYWGARSQKWQNDTAELFEKTVECNDVRNTIAINVRHSLIAYGDYDAFSSKTGP